MPRVSATAASASSMIEPIPRRWWSSATATAASAADGSVLERMYRATPTPMAGSLGVAIVATHAKWST